MARILLVEDNPSIIATMQDVLADMGHTPIVTDGRGAVSVAENLHPDLILLDLHLGPDTHGEEVFADLRMTPATRTIPVLITSAVPAAALIARTLGADDVLNKPFSIDLLEEHIDALLAKQHPH